MTQICSWGLEGHQTLMVVLRDQTSMFICIFLNLCHERMVYLILKKRKEKDWCIEFKCVSSLLRFYQTYLVWNYAYTTTPSVQILILQQ